MERRKMVRADLQATAFVLAVPDADATAAWWVEVMGFEQVMKVPGWAFVRRGACVLRLGSCPDALPPRDLGDHSYFGYVIVNSVDRLQDEISRAGAEIMFAPADQPWGMREMGVRTPDGHRIMFGQKL
jgi:catechol 2,3-dioxygenase-like lactoylglutathione lyase family enzyme